MPDSGAWQGLWQMTAVGMRLIVLWQDRPVLTPGPSDGVQSFRDPCVASLAGRQRDADHSSARRPGAHLQGAAGQGCPFPHTAQPQTGLRSFGRAEAGWDSFSVVADGQRQGIAERDPHCRPACAGVTHDVVE